MKSTLNERLHFLNYAYFGVDDTIDKVFDHLFDDNNQEVLPDNLILLAARKAYGDLQRRVPYIINTTEMERPINAELKNMKESFKSEVNTCLVEQLRGFEHHGINISDLIFSLSALGDNYQGLFKPNERFTIGLAQKWVNMTLKYLWILGAIDGDNLHVPIDSYIIKATTSSVDNMCLGLEYNYQHNRKSSWSSWENIDEYNNLQIRIRTEVTNRYHISPIKWENDAWIAIANM